MSSSTERSSRRSSSRKPKDGLSNPHLSQGRRQMLDLVNKLHSTGVQVDIDLPQIAVIGSQSSGKSSLIESISGIRLPRAAGTCTRCPMECRLSRSDEPWQCVVSLRFITDADGQPLGQARNEPFGDIIYDKKEIEDRIRRAQFAILTPKTSPKKFLTGDVDKRSTQLSFSLNAVTLQISGPEVADLSFCDLPGLIASVSNGSSQDDIALVEKLVTTYIKKRSCIILLTVACETDFENQGAHHLAKKYDPKGKRTIGVLTKPDRIPSGEESNWLPFIKNEKESLKHNWFCVKQPSSSDLKLNLTWSGARKMENNFFAATAPWCELESVHQQYLRTSNLVDRLSSVLSDLISKRLPPIQDELEKSIAATRHQLSRLPLAPSADPRSEIAALLHTFSSDLARHVEGVSDDRDSTFGEGIGLIQAIRPAQERFRMMIRATAPKFQPFERSEEGKKHLAPATFLQNEEGKEEEVDIGGKEDVAIEVKPIKRQESEHASESEGEDSEEDSEGEDSEDDSESESESEEDHQETPTVKQGKSKQSAVKPSEEAIDKTSEGTQSKGTSKKRKEPPSDVIYIDEVLERAHRARTRELPGSFPFVVQKTFINNITKEWADPAHMLGKTVHGTVLQNVKILVHKHFSEFGQGHLERRVQSIMQRHMKRCLERAEEKINWLLELEDIPFSLNTHYLADYKSKFLMHYKGAREKYSRADFINAIRQHEKKPKAASGSIQAIAAGNRLSKDNGEPTGIAKILIGLAEIGMTSVKPEDLAKLLPADHMEPALVIMADVRAYFQVAYKRFADVVPLAIDHEIVRGAAKDILRILYESLAVNGTAGENICKELAGESHEVEGRRADLQNKLERLEIASEELLTIRI